MTKNSNVQNGPPVKVGLDISSPCPSRAALAQDRHFDALRLLRASRRRLNAWRAFAPNGGNSPSIIGMDLRAFDEKSRCGSMSMWL